jgi:hypothetical protein
MLLWLSSIRSVYEISIYHAQGIDTPNHRSSPDADGFVWRDARPARTGQRTVAIGSAAGALMRIRLI